MIDVIFSLEHQTRTANLSGELRGSILTDKHKADFLLTLQDGGIRFRVKEVDAELCLRCNRPADDFVHENPNDHGWTGCATMHVFIGAKEKNLLQRTAGEVYLRTRSRSKGRAPTDDMKHWNAAIAEAKQAVEQMFAAIAAAELAEHDKYWADEYAKRAALRAGRTPE